MIRYFPQGREFGPFPSSRKYFRNKRAFERLQERFLRCVEMTGSEWCVPSGTSGTAAWCTVLRRPVEPSGMPYIALHCSERHGFDSVLALICTFVRRHDWNVKLDSEMVTVTAVGLKCCHDSSLQTCDGAEFLHSARGALRSG